MKAVHVSMVYGVTHAAAWVALCGTAMLIPRLWLLVSIAAFAAVLGGMTSGHGVLIGWVALIFGLRLSGAATVRLLWTQVVIVYVFAALNKLNMTYLSGGKISDRHVPPPEALFAVGGLVAEMWLAWAVWRRSRWALPVAVLLHGGIVVFMGTVSWHEFAMLGSFNAMMVIFVWLVTRSGTDHGHETGSFIPASTGEGGTLPSTTGPGAATA